MKAAPAGVHSSALPPMYLLPRRPPSSHPQESTTLFNLHRIIQISLCKSKMPSDSRLEQQVGFYKAKLVRKSAGQLRPGVLVLHLSPASGPSLLLSLLELPGPICKQAFAFYLRGDKLKAPKTSELASTAGSAFMKGQAPLKYVLAAFCDAICCGRSAVLAWALGGCVAVCGCPSFHTPALLLLHQLTHCRSLLCTPAQVRGGRKDVHCHGWQARHCRHSGICEWMLQPCGCSLSLGCTAENCTGAAALRTLIPAEGGLIIECRLHSPAATHLQQCRKAGAALHCGVSGGRTLLHTPSAGAALH